MILADHIIKFTLGLKAEIDDMKDRMDLIEAENKDLRSELVDMAKDPKIKGFYYCDPPEGFPADDDLFPLKVTLSNSPPKNPIDIQVVGYEAPLCFNCDSDCSACERVSECAIQTLGDDICERCSSASDCFS
jgi:hypothetical protein